MKVLRQANAILAIAISALSFTGLPADAQNYPTRSITLIAPFPAGGPLDAIARIISEPMQAALGQPTLTSRLLYQESHSG